MRRNDPVVHVGILPVFIMLVVFSLIGFAALSLTSARADDKFSEAYAEMNRAYYEGISASQEYQASLSGELSRLYAQYGSDPEAYFAKAGGEMIEVSFPCGEGQAIALRIRVLNPAKPDGSLFEVLSEKLVHEEVFDYDAPLHVFGADGP
ncbi:MAG: hypothetical protein J6I56_00535 [Lachnospiraceae bacterium]|nr:hypothetical protein [Lachnospiraceae bacterium]